MPKDQDPETLRALVSRLVDLDDEDEVTDPQLQALVRDARILLRRPRRDAAESHR